MKKARLIITPLEYEFISIYHISPEALFERRCMEVSSTQAAKEINELMDIAWNRMLTVDKEKYELYAKGFKSIDKENVPFDAT